MTRHSKKANVAEAEWTEQNGLERKAERQARAKSLYKEFGLSVSCEATADP